MGRNDTEETYAANKDVFRISERKQMNITDIAGLIVAGITLVTAIIPIIAPKKEAKPDIAVHGNDNLIYQDNSIRNVYITENFINEKKEANAKNATASEGERYEYQFL